MALRADRRTLVQCWSLNAPGNPATENCVGDWAQFTNTSFCAQFPDRRSSERNAARHESEKANDRYSDKRPANPVRLSRMDVLDWLLDSDPAIRWQVLSDLADAPVAVFERERARTAVEGWGDRLL